MAPSLAAVGVAALATHFACVSAQDSYGSYPTTYPFADESYVPDFDLPDLGTPTKTYDENDGGGYYLHEGIEKSMDLQEGPVFYTHGTSDNNFNFADCMGMTLWGITVSTFFDDSNWNCTDKGTVYTTDDFPGVMNGETICTDCCEHYIGTPEFGNGQLDRLDTMEEFQRGNGCGATDVELYCTLTDDWQFLCMEQFLDREERLVPKPCPDNLARWLLTCPVVKAAGMFEDIDGWEPAHYMAELTAAHSITIYSIEYTSQDRVCHPYSYYHPESAESSAGAGLAPLALAALTAQLLF